jgi:hypothetical protein
LTYSFNPSGVAETISNIASHPNLPKNGYDQLLSVFQSLPHRKLELITRLAKGLAKSHWTTDPTQIKAMKDHLDSLPVDDDCDPSLLIYKKLDLTFAFLQNRSLPVDFITEERRKIFEPVFWETLNDINLTQDLLMTNTFFDDPITQDEFNTLTNILLQVFPIDDTRVHVFHALITYLKADVNSSLINLDDPGCMELIRKMQHTSLNLGLAIMMERELSQRLGVQGMTNPSGLVLIDMDLLSLIGIHLGIDYLDEVKERVQNGVYGPQTSKISDLLASRPEIADQLSVKS